MSYAPNCHTRLPSCSATNGPHALNDLLPCLLPYALPSFIFCIPSSALSLPLIALPLSLQLLVAGSVAALAVRCSAQQACISQCWSQTLQQIRQAQQDTS